MPKSIPNPKFCKLTESAAIKLNLARNILQRAKPLLIYTDSEVIETALDYYLEVKECVKSARK